MFIIDSEPYDPIVSTQPFICTELLYFRDFYQGLHHVLMLSSQGEDQHGTHGFVGHGSANKLFSLSLSSLQPTRTLQIGSSVGVGIPMGIYVNYYRH